MILAAILVCLSVSLAFNNFCCVADFSTDSPPTALVSQSSRCRSFSADKNYFVGRIYRQYIGVLPR